ncbi:putative transposase [Mycobacterium xenopi 3993]|nr:putative transposase [Mycobacterium xenopi 3993]
MVQPAAGPVYPVVFIDAIHVKIATVRSPTGPSTWPSESPVPVSATSWVVGRRRR